MKTIRTRKMRTHIIALLLGCSIFAAAQDKLTEAFSESYKYEALAEYPKAIAAIKAQYNEGSYEINLRLGWLHYLSGLYTESQKYYSKAIQLMPYSVEARFGYIYPASALGSWEQVAEKYKDILKIDPGNSQANYNLGLILYNKNKFDEASKYFGKVVNLYPFDYNATLMLAWSYLKLGKYREAKVLFNKVLLIAPQDASALEGLKMIK